MNEDDIRLRRLARLGASTQKKTEAQSQNGPSVESQVKTDQRPTEATFQNRDSANSSPTAPPTVPQPAAVPEPKPEIKQALPKPPKSLDIVAFVLGVTLRENTPKSVYLPDLASSRMETDLDKPLNLDDDLDAAIWEVLTTSAPQRPQRDPVNWLLNCWRRVDTLGRRAPADDLAKIRVALARTAVLSTTADSEDEVWGDLPQALLAQSSSIPWDFVDALVKAAKEQEMLDQVLTTIFTGIQPRGFVEGYRVEFSVTERLLEIDTVAARVLDLPLYELQAEWGAQDLASKHFLGPYFAISPIDGEAPVSLFKDRVFEGAQPHAMRSAATTTFLEVDLIVSALFRIVNKLVRAGPGSRRRVLDWLTAILNANHRQVAMQVDRTQVNATGFMLNATHVLIQLCQPFTDLRGTQLGKINLDYYKHTVSYDVSDQTKLLADQAAPYNMTDRLTTPLNFVTEVFFLANGFLYFGLQGAMQAFRNSQRQLEHMQSELERHRTQLDAVNQPALRQMLWGRYQGMLTGQRCRQVAYMTVVQNPKYMAPVLHFATFSLFFSVRASKENLDAYGSYPEFLVEAPLEAMTVCMRMPEVSRLHADSLKLVEVVLYFMRTSGALRNPYLRSRMVEVLWLGGTDEQYTDGSTRPGMLVSVFNTSKECHEQLLPALMQVWIDIEHTGRSSEFYEKFHVRELVAHVLKILWRFDIYRRRLEEESIRDPEFFVRFVALLLNDSIYLLDEALTHLQEIHEAQNASASDENPGSSNSARAASSTVGDGEEEDDSNDVPRDATVDLTNPGANDEDQPQSPEQRIASIERQASTMLSLGNITVDLLYTFTKSVPAIFVTPEIVKRFAVMLNYNLAALVGPRCHQLKVRDPTKVGFNPRALLQDVVRVFLNLASQPAFVQALARDERSFSPANYSKAADILQRYNLLSPQELVAWRKLSESVEIAHQNEEDEEEGLGEIPDEFLDPLMFEIMENPVILPGSKVSIDLSTIKTHLLSDPTDPFNRMPLTLDQVIPDVDLKNQIEKFKAERRQARMDMS